MSEKRRSNPKYGYKWLKEKIEKENPDLHNLILLFEKEYKSNEIKTITKPCYVLSRMSDVVTSFMKTQEKKPNWTMKDTMRSFVGGLNYRLQKDEKENGKENTDQ